MSEGKKSKIILNNPTEHRYEIYGDGIGHVEYVEHMGNDLKIVNSARVSFNKHTEKMRSKDRKLVQYLTHNGHTSTLEHNLVTFRFKVPLYVRSQHHRHRTWSYNEISRRYTSENLEFYEPLEFRTQHKSDRQASNENETHNPVLNGYSNLTARDLLLSHHKTSVDIYNAMLDNGVCREQARGILPQNMYTEYYGTANLNNLFKFIKLRLDPHAQWEIQKVAEAVLEILKEIYPAATEGWLQHLESKSS